MKEEIDQLRSSGSPAEAEFALSDVLYFCEKGLESIVDDQVTQRFSSEELASWNLLTRTNQNFRYISLRLTIIWGVGVFVRYSILLPLRSVGLAWTLLSEITTVLYSHRTRGRRRTTRELVFVPASFFLSLKVSNSFIWCVRKHANQIKMQTLSRLWVDSPVVWAFVAPYSDSHLPVCILLMPHSLLFTCMCKAIHVVTHMNGLKSFNHLDL